MQRWVILPDMQVPYEDKRSLAAVEKYMAAHTWDGYLNLGDFLDFNEISSYVDGKPGAVSENVADTFAAGNEILDRHCKLIRSETCALDLVGASRRFYAEFGDSYDQLLFWTDTRVTHSGTFALESTIKNAITGIGQDLGDLAQAYGSPGRLESVVVMDNLGKYPSDPTQRANGENSTLALVAHETGHRWGATLRFRDASGAVSDAWLGRQLAHWSFFTDSDASVLEGNDLEDRGGGSFRTAATVQRYSLFDLYAMAMFAPWFSTFV